MVGVSISMPWAKCLYMIFLIFIFFGVFHMSAQHLVGARSNAVAQNYKLPSYSQHRFEGFSVKQIAKQESKTKKEEKKLNQTLKTV